MKKIFGLLVLALTLFVTAFAYAEELTAEMSVIDTGAIVIDGEADFALYAPSGEVVSTAKAVIGRDTTELSLKFDIADYISGGIYSFSALSGVEELDYIGVKYAVGDKIPLNTADAMSFRMALTPVCVPPTGVRTDKLTFRFHLQKKGIVTASNAKFYLCDRNGTLMQVKSIAFDNSTDVAELSFTVPQYYTGEKFYLIPVEGADGVSYYDKEYLIHSPIEIGTYASLDEQGATVIGNSFDLGLTPEYVTIDSAPDSEYARLVEAQMNASGIDSRTNYLIWISKKDFSVNVFKGSQGVWDFVTCFSCSIGKPTTPTIEGVFEYFAYQDIWKYADYYCAPIMRFAPKGYAMHSTLVRYNGTPYDGRLGMKISHGCVRIAPENIRWLADNMPLHTRVYITA
ncbi:MAG: L,D-transpeptidase [Clostridia bacterium]|nr:L,D-transpeptidase [Clostridia bacterium]